MSRQMPRKILLTALGTIVFASLTQAQVELDRRRPAPAKGAVDVESAFGTISIHAWERNEVQVRGTLAAGVESFDLDGDKEGVQVSVSVPDAWLHATGEDPAFRSQLDVTVPVGSRLSVRTVNAAVTVDGVAGKIDVATINGDVRVDAPAAAAELETMTGTIELHGRATAAELQTISGGVVADGLSGEVRVETVSGKVDLGGTNLSDLGVKTTTGAVVVRTSLARKGSLEVETFSSPVRLVLPRSAHAQFELESFSGKIQSDFCAGTPVTHEPFEPLHKLRCSTGTDEFEIQVHTHNADIVIAAEGGEKEGQP
jgi:Toastrack DUF4097